MSDTETNPAGPSGQALLKGLIWTFVGAIAVTILFILPAEFGVDPTGVGERLGLTRLAAVDAPDVEQSTRVVQGTFPDAPSEEEFDYYDPETLGDPFSRSHDTTFKSETMVVELAEFEQVEVKAVMHQGDALVYNWKLLDGETVYTDFHGDPLDPDPYPDSYWIRYKESETPSASGSLVAPFDGNHGWYWLNIEENPIRIELEVHGYYESVEEIMRSFQ